MSGVPLNSLEPSPHSGAFFPGALDVLFRPASFYHFPSESTTFKWIAHKQLTLTSPDNRKVWCYIRRLRIEASRALSIVSKPPGLSNAMGLEGGGTEIA